MPGAHELCSAYSKSGTYDKRTSDVNCIFSGALCVSCVAIDSSELPLHLQTSDRLFAASAVLGLCSVWLLYGVGKLINWSWNEEGDSDGILMFSEIRPHIHL